jgi:predicted nucleic acid-binding protein
MAKGPVLMVLVDTTVWIDFFSGISVPHVTMLENLIDIEEDLSLCGVILAEVLQGIREEKDYVRIKNYFNDLLILPMQDETFIYAADIYRALRKRGITIRKPVDCMIASVAIENDIPLLHNDRDFDYIAKYANLRIYS